MHRPLLVYKENPQHLFVSQITCMLDPVPTPISNIRPLNPFAVLYHHAYFQVTGLHDLRSRPTLFRQSFDHQRIPALIADVTGFSIAPPFVFPESLTPFVLCHPSSVYAQTTLSINSAHVCPLSAIRIST